MEAQTDITWETAFKVWWLLIWRFTWYGALGSMAVTVVTMIYGGLMHMPLRESNYYSVIIALPLSLPIQVWVVRSVLRRRHRVGRFRLTLAPDENSA